MSREDSTVDRLFDYAMMHRAEGFTGSEAMAELGIGRSTFEHALHQLRQILGGGEEALPATPTGGGREWVYRLTEKLDETEPWVASRVKDARTRLKTLTASLGAIVHATDGRTKDGKIARAMHMDLRHLLERLELMDAQ